MSYSSEVKGEILRSWELDQEDFRSFMAAIMKSSGTLSLLPGLKLGFRIATENPVTARFILKNYKKFLDEKVNLVVTRGTTLKKKNLYVITLDEVDELRQVLSQAGVIHDTDQGLVLSDGIHEDLIATPKRRRAYLKGAFLGSGSISNPEKQYHLEIVASSEDYAKELVKLLKKLDIKGNVVERKGSFVAYVKGSEQVVDLLNLLGAHQSLLETENIRIVKGLRNNVNRLVNCETANLGKTVLASVRQGQAIEHIAQTVGLARLPKNLREVAELRLAYPDASLKELGEMLHPKVGKSGINHRLRKIEEIAGELTKEGE